MWQIDAQGFTTGGAWRFSFRGNSASVSAGAIYNNGLDQRGFRPPHGNGCDIAALEVGGDDSNIVFATGFEPL